MRLTKDCIGKKVRGKDWEETFWLIPTFITKEFVVGKREASNFEEVIYFHVVPDWEYYEEPKKIVRYAPALIEEGPYTEIFSYVISRQVFSCEEDAKQWAQDEHEEFIKWPANDSMWVEIKE